MSFEDACHIGLGLGLGSCHGRFHENRVVKSDRHQQRQKASLKLDNMFSSSSLMNTQQEAIRNLNEPSLTLGLSSEETSYGAAAVKKIDVNIAYEESINDAVVLRQQASSPHATVMSSFSNASVKRERDVGCSEDMEVEKVSSRISDEDEEASGRKKLRLTKEQSALLEESFKEHSTLNPKQKQALAKQLNLRPRQVEVWFQNRRARTKLKQTEVDCEFLKKCCETLTDENRRLQKELQELKALKLAQPLYMQLPAATLTMCPSCERIGNGSNSGGDNSSKNTFTIAAKPHFFNPFTHSSSAAC